MTDLRNPWADPKAYAPDLYDCLTNEDSECLEDMGIGRRVAWGTIAVCFLLIVAGVL